MKYAFILCSLLACGSAYASHIECSDAQQTISWKLDYNNSNYKWSLKTPQLSLKGTTESMPFAAGKQIKLDDLNQTPSNIIKFATEATVNGVLIPKTLLCEDTITQ